MSERFEEAKRSASHFFLGTLFSRMSGYLRDAALAFYFGSSPKIASFMIAFRFALLFRRLFGESSLQSTFIPHFEFLRLENSLKKAQLFFRDLLFSFFGLLVAIVVMVEIGLFALEPFYQNNLELIEMIGWIKIMLPSLIFICLFALSTALLQCHQKYLLPSVAPALFNLVWIVMAALEGYRSHHSTTTLSFLAFGVALGSLFQWLLIAKKSFSYGLNQLTLKEVFSFRKTFSFLSSKHFVQSFFLSILGIGASQFNSAIDCIFAKYVDPSGPAYLWYAIRIYQIPLALFGIGLVSAFLPPLSRIIQEGKKEEIGKIFHMMTSRTIGLMLPSSFALFALGGAGINLLFGRGSFSEASILETLFCLWGYTLGLLPAALVFVYSSCFYAKKNFKIPLRATLWTVLLNILLNLFFIFGSVFQKKCPAAMIAIATSLSSFFNLFYLSYFLKKENLGFFTISLKKTWVKIFVIGISVTLLILTIGHLFLGDATLEIVFFKKRSLLFSKHFMTQIFIGCSLTLCFLTALFALAKFLHAEEILDFFQKTLFRKNKSTSFYETKTRKSEEG